MAGGIHLGALVESAYERRGDELTLVYEGRRLAASERLDAARRLTGGLVALGVRPGDRVVVCMANGPEVEVAYAAIWRAGAVVTPAVFLLSEAELRHVLVPKPRRNPPPALRITGRRRCRCFATKASRRA